MQIGRRLRARHQEVDRRPGGVRPGERRREPVDLQRRAVASRRSTRAPGGAPRPRRSISSSGAIHGSLVGGRGRVGHAEGGQRAVAVDQFVVRRPRVPGVTLHARMAREHGQRAVVEVQHRRRVGRALVQAAPLGEPDWTVARECLGLLDVALELRGLGVARARVPAVPVQRDEVGLKRRAAVDASS